MQQDECCGFRQATGRFFLTERDDEGPEKREVQ